MLFTIPDGTILEANEAACRMFRCTEEELRRLGRQGVTPPGDPGMEAGVEERARTGRTHTEAHLRRADGSVFPVEISSVVFANEAGEPRTVTLIHDITWRRDAERAIVESEERFRTLSMEAPIGIIRADAAGGRTFVNPKWCEMSGLSEQEAVGEGWLKAVHPDDVEVVRREWMQAALRGDAVSVEHRFVRLDGTVLWVSAQAAPIRDAEGSIRGFVGTVVDISASRAALEEMHRANEELRHLDRMRDAFVATAAHDLRAPLTTIIGFAATLRGAWRMLPDADIQEFLGRIERQGQRLNQMVEDLLTTSRIRAGAIAAQTSAVILAPVIRAALENIPEMLEAEVSCGDDIAVRADPGLLEQVLTNYVANAAKYGAPPISIEGEVNGENVEIRVRDCGPGVLADLVPELFEPFVRGPQESGRVPGTGLGLAIVRGLVEAQGGEAWYEPNRPTGACFGIRLPRA